MINLTFYPHYEEMEYVIDGANMYHHEKKYRNTPVLCNLLLMIENLKALGVKENKIKIYCDATLFHKIDDRRKYLEFLKKGNISQTPAGVKADEYILNYCLTHESTLIISNDLFREYYCQLPDAHWIEKKRITYLKNKKQFQFVPMIKKLTINNINLKLKLKKN